MPRIPSFGQQIVAFLVLYLPVAALILSLAGVWTLAGTFWLAVLLRAGVALLIMGATSGRVW